MQLRGVEHAVIVDKESLVQPYCVDHQRIALVMADRFAIPGEGRVRRVWDSQMDMPDLRSTLVEERDFARGV
jgi:hypothetical protein